MSQQCCSKLLQMVGKPYPSTCLWCSHGPCVYVRDSLPANPPSEPCDTPAPVSEKSQIDHFASDLDALVNRYRAEYELTVASVVGVLEVQKHLLIQETLDADGE